MGGVFVGALHPFLVPPFEIPVFFLMNVGDTDTFHGYNSAFPPSPHTWQEPVGFSTFFLPAFISHDCRPNCMWHYDSWAFGCEGLTGIGVKIQPVPSLGFGKNLWEEPLVYTAFTSCALII